MAPSTSPASPRLSEPPARFGLDALDGFYRLHASIYDWTRPLLLLRPPRGRARARAAPGRARARRRLRHRLEPAAPLRPRGAGRGDRALGADAAPGRARGSSALRPRRRRGARPAALRQPRRSTRAGADAVLFSYSLSMIPPYEEVLERARARPAARRPHRGRRLPRRLGPGRLRPAPEPRRSSARERFDALERVFPRHRLELRSPGSGATSCSRRRAPASAATAGACRAPRARRRGEQRSPADHDPEAARCARRTGSRPRSCRTARRSR